MLLLLALNPGLDQTRFGGRDREERTRRPCEPLFVLVALGLQAFAVLMLGHFRTALFLDGTHVLSPGMTAPSDRDVTVCCSFKK
jgi:hypothetical protein